VKQRIDRKLKLPASQEYLGKEVDNVVAGCNQIANRLSREPNLKLTPELICEFNELVLSGLEVEDHVHPGNFRTESVGVAGYRGAPWQDCPCLMGRLCDWLNTGFEGQTNDWTFPVAITKSMLAHLYIAWIHPFGDGNGRTARLIEFMILVQSGIPWPAAHLLSNHYNKTRSRYFAELDKSSKAADGVISFINYAIQGFVDGLGEQLDHIRKQQWDVIWENYVHDFFRDKDTPAHKRRKHLVLDLPEVGTPRKRVASVSARVAAEYATKGEKTLARDLNALVEAGLVKEEAGGYRPCKELILAFLPPRLS
jgi:Fic family protein